MTQSKKELVLAAMDNKPVDRVPVGFWFHFLGDEIHSDSFQHPELIEQLYAGQTKYIETAKPDFVKIMTDGFFPYENRTAFNLKSAADFKRIQPLADDDPWFTTQIAYAKRLTSKYGNDVAMFYNLFCAGTTVKFMLPDITQGDAWLSRLIQGLRLLPNAGRCRRRPSGTRCHFRRFGKTGPPDYYRRRRDRYLLQSPESAR